MASRLIDARNTLDGLLKQLADKEETLSPPSNEDLKEPDRSTSGAQSSTSRKRTSSSGNRTPRKRIKRENPAQDTETLVTLPTQTTYIHKLFDRSVDFAKFNKDTSLYVLARAWMKNKPHEVEKDTAPERPAVSEPVQNPDVVQSLPPPVGENLSCSIIPDPVVQTRAEPWNVDDFYSDGPGVSDLLNQHMTRWKQVRRRWKDASHNNQRRYISSIQLIRKLFNQQL